MTDAETLYAAARLLEAQAGISPEPWHVEKDGADCYVEGNVHGNWFAYTGNDTGAEYYAQWICLMDPIQGRLLADVLRGVGDTAANGGEVDPGWVAYAEVLLSKASAIT